MDPSKIDVSFGGVPMVRNGVGLGPAAERRIAKVFHRKEFTIPGETGTGPSPVPSLDDRLVLRLRADQCKLSVIEADFLQREPCKLRGIVLTFQGFRADVSRLPLPPFGEQEGNY